jgi:hypothetical protein
MFRGLLFVLGCALVNWSCKGALRTAKAKQSLSPRLTIVAECATLGTDGVLRFTWASEEHSGLGLKSLTCSPG